jgi:glycosyltransferase involved in cell wall biosynthesis
MKKNIGFISTRFSGTDGVSMESSKWASVLEAGGSRCYWLAGDLERDPSESMLVPEMHFKHEENIWITERIFGSKGRSSEVTRAIHDLKRTLKQKIEDFVLHFKIDIIIVQNALTIPLHVPLGVAITEFIAETQIPTIAHHHDFYWERTRFILNGVGDYLRMSFPPNLPSISHVVINSAAQEELALRTGITSVVIPNVIDFDHPPHRNEEGTQAFRNSLGLGPDDKIILQPTRVVQRKGIEHALQLVGDLKDPKYKLVISHEAGDEGFEYLDWLKKEAHEHGVDLRMVNLRVSDPYYTENNGDGYSLWDIYPHADFITYPSLYEGFGNAFLEAIYFYKPLLINRYAIFVRDIEPKGFDLVVMDGFLTKKNVDAVKEIIESPIRRKAMVEHNYATARRHYSFNILRRRLIGIMINFFGMDS